MKILNWLRNRIWDLLLFFNHSSVKLTGNNLPLNCLNPSDDGLSGRIVVSLHRNGMLDLFLVRRLLPKVVALTSVQWHQNFFTRWLIGGIAVTRAKDKDKKIKAENYDALEQCVKLLQEGQAVGIAPEGTSQLGPGHLPFQKAAARVAAKVLEVQGEVRVLPVSPVYLEAWGWRSPAELYIGRELVFKAGQNMNEIHREISLALEEITLKAPDFKSLMARQAAAWELSWLRPESKRSFSDLLLESEAGLMDELAAAYQAAHAGTPRQAAFFGAFVPGGLSENIVNGGFSAISRLALIMLNALANFVRLLIGPALALSRKLRRGLTDDLNVVALWRGLLALPLISVWLAALGLIIACWGGPLLFFIPLSLAGLSLWLEPIRLQYQARKETLEFLGPDKLGSYFAGIIAVENRYSEAKDVTEEKVQDDA